MSFSVNPSTFQSMNIETGREKHFFLSQLSALLTQITSQITNQTKYTSAAILPIDLSQPGQATVPAWTAYTCTLVSGAGTITAQTRDTSFMQIGKLVFVNGWVQVTNIGTASGSYAFTLPVTAKKSFAIAVKENGVTGAIWSGSTVVGGSTVTVVTSANVFPTWANNQKPTFTFSYEAA